MCSARERIRRLLQNEIRALALRCSQEEFAPLQIAGRVCSAAEVSVGEAQEADEEEKVYPRCSARRKRRRRWMGTGR